jgi:predicted HicB family RNase H-like nuclease
MKQLEYKGYIGSMEVDVENGVIVGRLLFIRDVIAYSSADIQGVQRAFEEAVDDYLATCEEAGDQPDTPCKGSFNVRIPPELHRQVMVKARAIGISLNEYVTQAIRSVQTERPQNHVYLTLQVEENSLRTFTTQSEKGWEVLSGNKPH